MPKKKKKDDDCKNCEERKKPEDVCAAWCICAKCNGKGCGQDRCADCVTAQKLKPKKSCNVYEAGTGATIVIRTAVLDAHTCAHCKARHNSIKHRDVPDEDCTSESGCRCLLMTLQQQRAKEAEDETLKGATDED